MKTIHLFEILTWDGGNRHNTTGIAFDNHDAGEAYKNANKFDTIFERQFIVISSLDELKAVQEEQTRLQALEKLTMEERRVLGL